jgi:uncharacterized protein YigE (DUF2233 family)
MIQTARTKTGSTYNSYRVRLYDGGRTTIHVARHKKQAVRPRLVTFEKGTTLLHWCREQNIQHAMGGGFYFPEKNQLLGEYWQSGQNVEGEPFLEPWNMFRGSLYIQPTGATEITRRYRLPSRINGDLLQSGPLLVKDNRPLAVDEDPEGFSRDSHQFDSDITVGRYPRSAIGLNEDEIICVVAEGRSEAEAGLTFSELAYIMTILGARDALNLDGGSKNSLIFENKFMNQPVGQEMCFPFGYPIKSAIVFDNL